MGGKRSYPFASCSVAKRPRMFNAVRRYFGFRPRRTYRRAPYRGFKRRYRRRGRFNVKKLRTRRRTAALKKSLVQVFRDQYTIEPDGYGKLRWLTYASLNNFKKVTQYAQLYDEFKVLKIYQKFRLENSADVENDQKNIDITHWSCYDPDARNRKFKDLEDYQKHNASKWHIFKPYQVKTSILTPKWQSDPKTGDATGIKRVDSPWFDCGTDRAIPSTNGIQHLFIGPTNENDPTAARKFKIVVEETLKVAYRGLRQGQVYENNKP